MASVLFQKQEWASPAFCLGILGPSIPETTLTDTMHVAPPCYYATGKMNIELKTSIEVGFYKALFF